MRRWRLGLGTAGILLGLFGVFRLVTQIPASDLVMLVGWLIGALIIHDGVLTPIVLSIGWVVSRTVPPRARAFLQAALVVMALITVIAVPLILKRGSQPASKAILQQNYGGHLALLLGIVAAVTLLAYALYVARGAARTHPATRTADGATVELGDPPAEPTPN